MSEHITEKDARFAKAQLSAVGLRPTVQRMAIYTYLLENPTHPTADMIYQALSEQYPAFSRATVYNTVHALAQCGLIRCVNIDAQEQRFDGNRLDHGHFRCTNCGHIYDFPLAEEKAHTLCPDGFTASVTDVFISGKCKNCK